MGRFLGPPRQEEVLEEHGARTSPKTNPGLWTPEARLCGPDGASCQERLLEVPCQAAAGAAEGGPRGHRGVGKPTKRDVRRCVPRKQGKGGPGSGRSSRGCGPRGAQVPPELPPPPAWQRLHKDSRPVAEPSGPRPAGVSAPELVLPGNSRLQCGQQRPSPALPGAQPASGRTGHPGHAGLAGGGGGARG